MSMNTTQGLLRLRFSPELMGWVLTLGKAFLGVFQDKPEAEAHFQEVSEMLDLDEATNRFEYNQGASENTL